MAYKGIGAANSAFVSSGTATSFTTSPSMAASLTAGTTVTATLGNITATNGDIVASTAATGVTLGGGARVVCGTGDPAGAVTAPQGSLYLRLDGSSGSTRAYINTNGTTGWTNITTAT